MNDLNSQNEEIKQELALGRLSRIDVLFAAFGPIISALFCIAQYFLDETIYFNVIAVILYALILAITYYLAVSNEVKKYEKFWEHIKKYSKTAGILNPFVLATGILLAIVRNIGVLILCIVFVIAQIVMYVIAGSKGKS